LACNQKRIKTAKFLIAVGANMETSDMYEITALYDAITNGNMEIVNLLMGEGANIDAANEV